MTVCFTYSAVNYFFSNPEWRNVYDRNAVTSYGRSASGTLYRYSKSITLKKQVLRWDGMNQKEREQMETMRAAIGTNDFALVDHQGETWTGRFLSGELNFEEVADQVLSNETFIVDGELFASSTRENAKYSVQVEIEIE